MIPKLEWGVRRQGEVETFPDFVAAYEFADRYVYGLPGVEVVVRVEARQEWTAICGPGGSTPAPEPAPDLS